MGLALIALVWGGGSMELADGMDPKALARDSLERLRRVAAARAAPQASEDALPRSPRRITRSIAAEDLQAPSRRPGPMRQNAATRS